MAVFTLYSENTVSEVYKVYGGIILQMVSELYQFGILILCHSEIVV